MTDERRFGELWEELQRVGVDAANFPAGFTVPGEDALRILRVLPAGAGPGAFLTAIREEQTHATERTSSSATSASPK